MNNLVQIDSFPDFSSIIPLIILYYRWWPTGTGKSSYTLQCVWFVSQVSVRSAAYGPFDWLYNQVTPLITTVVVLVIEINTSTRFWHIKHKRCKSVKDAYHIWTQLSDIALHEFHSWVDRVPTWCSGVHGFDACWGFRFFLHPTLTCHVDQLTFQKRLCKTTFLNTRNRVENKMHCKNY